MRRKPAAHATATAATIVAVSSQLMCCCSSSSLRVLADVGAPWGSHDHCPCAHAPWKAPAGRKMMPQPQDDDASVSMVMSGGKSRGAGRMLTPL
jgi:hypothetical protein